MSVRLYIGNLPEELSRQELEAVFADAGDSISTKIITDRKTNKCRGFGFVTVKSDEQADEIIEKYNGYLLKDSPLKVERAQPRSKDKEKGGEEQLVGNGEESGNSGSSGGGRRKGGSNNNSKSRRSTTPQVDSDIQPDPRWAQELEKLKQLLAAQTTNS